MQLDLRTLLIVLVSMYACLGLVCLLLPYRIPGSRAVTDWGYGMLMLAAGMAGIALRDTIPDLLSIVLANGLILAAFPLSMRSVRPAAAPGVFAFGWFVIGAAVLAIAYFTYLHAATRLRIVIVSLAIAMLVVHPVIALIEAAKESGRARRFTAACLGGIGLVMLARAVLTVVLGVNQDFLASNLVQFGSLLAFGILVVLSTLGVIWIEIEKLRAELAQLAMIDPLTATLNRRAFMLEYERELSRCARDKTGLALAIFDLDYFKQVNDTHGHLVGDRVLRAVADRLRASLRGHDLLGRYGGEEFVLLMPGSDAAAAIAGTERARLAVGESPIQAGPLSIRVRLSAGVAVYGIHGSDREALLRSADKALYQAKRGGRNRVVVAHAAPAGTP